MVEVVCAIDTPIPSSEASSEYQKVNINYPSRAWGGVEASPGIRLGCSLLRQAALFRRRREEKKEKPEEKIGEVKRNWAKTMGEYGEIRSPTTYLSERNGFLSSLLV